MTASQPLEGIDLIDCAKANTKHGIETASQQCGYGQDLEAFISALQIACQDIGVELQELSDLLTEQQRNPKQRGIEIAPDSTSSL